MSHGGREIGFEVVLAILSLVVLILIGVLSLVCRKKPVQSEETLPAKLCARAYALAEVDAATEGFSQRRVLGEGQLGKVYAAMTETGELVAVKRIHPRLVLSNAGFGFSSVIKSLSLAQHPHIVPIIGFSEAPGERIIVMEFVGVVSLDFYLHHNPDGSSLLDWSHRLRIAAGAARGLQFLHEGMAPNTVHGAVKPSNILIDARLCARVCDYGLSFLAPKENKGLVGYVDDEFWQGRGNGACKENDVYGFGVVLLELLSGRCCEEGWLVKWALPLLRGTEFRRLFDQRLAIPSNVQPLVRLAKVASACVGNSRKSRPTMGQVAAILNDLEMAYAFENNLEKPIR